MQPGQHIHFDGGYGKEATSVHPGSVIFTAMRQLGYIGRLGDLPDRAIPEMLRTG